LAKRTARAATPASFPKPPTTKNLQCGKPTSRPAQNYDAKTLDFTDRIQPAARMQTGAAEPRRKKLVLRYD
jgi:hypothetical protein